MKPDLLAAAALAAVALLTACGRSELPAAASSTKPDPCALVLASRPGETPDPEIVRLQRLAASGDTSGHAWGGAAGPAISPAYMERLGWAFVRKARTESDPGFYLVAEQAAACLEASATGGRDAGQSPEKRGQSPDVRRPDPPAGAARAGNPPDVPEALLLRAHVLVNRHRFHEAEAVARRLVARRGLSFDYAVLGDSLMEQGRLDEAVAAYEAMMDQKPGPQAWVRSAQARWITGDLDGAIEMMARAARAVDGADPEPAAWARTRLALFALQKGDPQGAQALADSALALQPGYAPAFVARGRALLAGGGAENAARAAEALRQAVSADPLPESLWILSEALRAAGRETEAAQAETELARRGPVDDPRTCALWLATRKADPHGADVDEAVRLARAEMAVREDVFTLDALGWALLRTGRSREAVPYLERALEPGTRDARLLLHAGLAALEKTTATSASLLDEARALGLTLLPSERALLDEGMRRQRAGLTAASHSSRTEVSVQTAAHRAGAEPAVKGEPQ